MILNGVVDAIAVDSDSSAFHSTLGLRNQNKDYVCENIQSTREIFATELSNLLEHEFFKNKIFEILLYSIKKRLHEFDIKFDSSQMEFLKLYCVELSECELDEKEIELIAYAFDINIKVFIYQEKK